MQPFQVISRCDKMNPEQKCTRIGIGIGIGFGDRKAVFVSEELAEDGNKRNQDSYVIPVVTWLCRALITHPTLNFPPSRSRLPFPDCDLCFG